MPAREQESETQASSWANSMRRKRGRDIL